MPPRGDGEGGLFPGGRIVLQAWEHFPVVPVASLGRVAAGYSATLAVSNQPTSVTASITADSASSCVTAGTPTDDGPP